MGLLERDQSAGELEQGQVVLGFLRPADQKGTVAVEPGAAGLDDPAACTPSRCGLFERTLVAAAADVGGVAATGRELSDPGIGVASVQTQALRIAACRLGPFDRNRVERRG